MRELAVFELPPVLNSADLGGRIGPTIEVGPDSLPRARVEPYTAALAAQMLLFFSVMYFGAFAREAVGSYSFPAAGTLFGAFSKSRIVLVVLFLALLIRAGTSVAVAVAAHSRVLALCVPFIAWATFLVITTLHKKNFFSFKITRFL